ncbi:MAG: hypothetical protein OXC37_05110, partial [Bdellovibrionaceae bacterium]|nr:hypothetical protein [Pseudobdellovibrionaceae bacterium]
MKLIFTLFAILSFSEASDTNPLGDKPLPVLEKGFESHDRNLHLDSLECKNHLQTIKQTEEELLKAQNKEKELRKALAYKLTVMSREVSTGDRLDQGLINGLAQNLNDIIDKQTKLKS